MLQLVLDTIASDYESNKQESNAMALQIIRDMIQTTIESCDSLATIQFLSQSQVSKQRQWEGVREDHNPIISFGWRSLFSLELALDLLVEGHQSLKRRERNRH